jgi:hypothetical protein
MPYCTIVEFEWNDAIDRAGFEGMMAGAGGGAAGAGDAPPAAGLLSRIVGVDDTAARIVEVWRSGADAQAFAAQSAAVTSQMPAPSRVVGFEVSSYQTA